MGRPDDLPGSPNPERASAPDDITIRSLRTVSEFQGCVEAQRQVWGDDFGDIVPASLLQISRKVGGVVAGAFPGEESRVVGFVYGLTGLRNGRLSHWSHMLAVVPDYRSRGIGQRLKEFQRRRVRERGVEEILWSFDPLIAGNAHFNLNILGVEIDAYHPEMYGETGSDLHSFGTDRFIARWDLSGDDPGDAGAGAAPDPERDAAEEAQTAPPLANAVPDREAGAPCDPRDPELRRVRIEIPGSILRIHRTDPELARRWRASTRSAFTRCLEAGYRVAGFTRLAEGDRGVYLLEREPR